MRIIWQRNIAIEQHFPPNFNGIFMEEVSDVNPYHQTIRELSDRLIVAQRPIRVLDSIKWGPEIKQAFFESKCKKLPPVTLEYYQQTPLSFNVDEKKEELYAIERDVRRLLGQFSAVGSILQRMCREYRELVRMLEARGTPEFSKISQELYGSAEDAFYAGAPRLKDLASLLSDALENIKDSTSNELDEKRFSSEEAVEILNERLCKYFGDDNQVRVKLSDGIIADAAAGAEYIKIRSDARFSERDLHIIEVHEGWVHMGTTLNGLNQPICTFLSKGPPSSTVTQEGLAIILEIFTFASYPERLRRLTNRITAIYMAEEGEDFLSVFNFYRNHGFNDDTSYSLASRVFRGSLPNLGPFTKDLVYSKGFVMIYNYIRLAVSRGLLSRIPILFAGKTTLEDQHILSDLVAEGLVTQPKYIPPQFADIAALSAWMSYSLFLNKLSLDRIALDYKTILQE
jgi:uncharacterized protein (TIGR02421 family)